MSLENRKIPLEVGEAYTQSWLNKGEIHTDDLHAFTVRLSEMAHFLHQLYPELIPDPTIAEGKEMGARFYLGMRKGATGVVSPSLVICGVKDFDPDNDKNGTEVYFDDSGAAIEYKKATPQNELYVYDFAYPCPDTCTAGSPLLHDV